jgi:phospholipid/cholesterol/gamma-HCH transport system substrate-binding protein
MALAKQARNELIVGLVFFGAMVLLGIYTILISGLLKGPQKTFLVSFAKPIYGLKKGDVVRVEGLEKGEVEDLRLNEDTHGNERIRAKLKVAKDVEIYKDGFEVKVTPFSPLGGRIIEIKRGYDSGKPEARWLSLEEQDGAQANTPRSQHTYTFIPGSAEGELLQTLNQLVDENKPGIARIVSNLAIVSDKLTRTDNVIGALLNDPATGSQLKDMSADLAETAYSLKKILKRIEKGQGIVGELTSEKSALHDNLNAAADYAKGALHEADTILANANAGKNAIGVFVSDNPEVTADTKAIVHDISIVTSDMAAGNGSLGKFVKNDRLYEGAAATAENLAQITGNITSTDPSHQSAVGVLLNDPETGARVRSTLGHLEAISRSIDQGDGALGLVVKDVEFRDRVNRIFTEVERLTVEFRDSVEDLREQAPINAFLGAVFAAF